jgi:predicted secreted protein
MVAPAYPNIHAGIGFTLNRGDGATPEVFSLLCTATTVSFKQANVTEDAMLQDCANPGNAPARQSVVTGKTWDVDFSGKADYTRFAVIQGDFDAGVAKNYRLVLAGTGAAGGGYYDGAAIITDLELSKGDNGMVAFTGKLKGQGLLAWTAAA